MTQHFCPNTGKELREANGIPNVFIVCQMQEKQRGLAKRPDGFVYLETKENYQKFKDFLKFENSHTNDTELDIVSVSLSQIADEKFIKQVVDVRDNATRPWIWTNDNHCIYIV